nr:class I SAM-dependent methyltransferase [Pseudomonas brassicacearum subsp. brassicacearum]
MIRRWLAGLRPAVEPSPPPATAVSPRNAGLYDAMLDGWFRSETGELLKGFAITADDTLLDVGCGEGVATLFAMRQGASVIFTDSEQDKVRDLARQVEAQAGAPFLGLVSNSLPLPLADGCANKIVCMEVLEHIHEPEPFMAELVRMGRPGAQYLLSVPASVGEHLQQGIAPPGYFQAPNHVQIFQCRTICRAGGGGRAGNRASPGQRIFFWVMGMIFLLGQRTGGWPGPRRCGA